MQVFTLSKRTFGTHTKRHIIWGYSIYWATYSAQKKVIYFPILDYWLDIGRVDDYNKAQEDIKHIKL